MAKITTAGYNDFVRNAKTMWRLGYDRVPAAAAQLYDISMNKESTTDHSSMDGFTFARRKTEGDDYSQQTPTQNYRITMTKYRIGLEAVITWEMRTYDRYTEMKRKLMNLGEASRQRFELDLTHRFTFATSTAYTDQDGTSVAVTVGDTLALASTAHTVNGSSTTYRNRVANSPAFSKGGLEAAELLFSSQMIDSAGNKVIVQPDTIITTDYPTLVNAVKEFLNSTAAPEGANSGVTNVYKSKYRHIVLPYLATTATGAYDSTKRTWWFLASVSHTDAICEVSEAPHMVAPSPGSNSEEFENDDWKFKTSAAYGIVISDPKWIVISLGDGTA